MPMAKTKLLVCVLFVIVAFTKANGQDIIFYKDGATDTVKIIETGVETISFKKYKRLDGPLYVVEKSKVVLIEFGNGKIEVFDSTETDVNALKKPYAKPVNIGRSILTTNIFSMFLGNVQVGYEILRENGKVGYKASVLASVLSEEIDISMILLGLDVNFYPNGQKWVSYYLGPAIRYGYVDYQQNGLNPLSPFVAVLINNGFTFNAGNLFYTGTQIGFGPGFYESETFPYGYLTLNLGVRF